MKISLEERQIIVPRWIILLIDQLIIACSFCVSYFSIKQFDLSSFLLGHFLAYILLFNAISGCVFYKMHIHTGLIRYSNIQDMGRIFAALFASTIAFGLIVEGYWEVVFSVYSNNVLVMLAINFFITSSLLIMFRTAVKEMFNLTKTILAPEKPNLLIVGSDRDAILMKHALEAGAHDYTVSGFIDLNGKAGNYIEQKPVFQPSAIEQAAKKLHIEKLMVTSSQLEHPFVKTLIEHCLRLEISVLTVPATHQWISGKLNLKQIKDLKIEDLLQREPIKIQNETIRCEIAGKRVLVTGAAGSIGSEIVRQLFAFDPGLIILFDQAETPLYHLQLEIQEKYPNAEIQVCIGDIRNFKRLMQIFEQQRPQVVFHAAAYKHVPMMEENPMEAILTNVVGTKNVADLALAYESEAFVMISSDKAVNPSNVMGASKRIAEIYIQSLHHLSLHERNVKEVVAQGDEGPILLKPKYITTRFGNVMGSNGSVIPRFQAQIKSGGPVTVTHPDITRFFMTIPEAVQLVLEAGVMGKGGEIFVFDMGEPVKINHLAEKMIELAGLVPHKDIEIVYTGLRPGEKLYEELLDDQEPMLPTHHPMIRIAQGATYAFDTVTKTISELIDAVAKGDSDEKYIVQKMKTIVPEYVSMNSQFEELDLCPPLLTERSRT